MRRVRPIALSIALALFGAAAGAQTQAQENATLRVAFFSIAQQPVRQALRQFAEQTGLQVVFREVDATLDEKTTQAVSGELSPAAALGKMLEKTDLKYEFVTERMVRVSSVTTQDAANSKEQAGKDSNTPTTMVEEGTGTIRLAQADGDVARSDQAVLRQENNAEGRRAGGAAVPEVLIEGSRILNTDIRRSRDDIQPYVVFDQEAIERSGARSIEEFLRGQLTASTALNSSSQNPDSTGNLSSFNLRGLGADETLILIDGRRMAGYAIAGGASQPDINGIPLSAIERIEVLPTTASGIYGGGATGGVINIVLRRDFSGVEVQLTYGNTLESDATNRQVDFTSGLNLEGGRTNILLTGSYSDADPLIARDRTFTQNGRDFILANNPVAIAGATIPPLGSTTNIRSSTGANLRLKNGNVALNSPVTSVPVNYGGIATDGGAALVSNAGNYNLEMPNTAQTEGALRSLLHAPTVSSIAGSVRREFAPWITAYLDVLGTKNSSSFLTNNNLGFFTIPAAASSNPFNQEIRVTTPVLGADQLLDSDMRSQRAVAGAILKLPHDWGAVVDYTWNRTRYSNSTPGSLNTSGATAAISSGSLNIFRDTNANPVDFSSFILAPWEVSDIEATLRAASLRFSGRLFTLPAGELMSSILLERRDERYGDYFRSIQSSPTVTQTTFAPSRSQVVNSAYLELSVPLVSQRNAIPGVALLEVQLATRYDDYTTKGANLITINTNGTPNAPILRETNNLTSTDPTIGLRYKPVRDVMLRASYGTGFLPPNVGALLPALPTTTSAVVASVTGLRDPLRGNELLGAFTNTGGGNPDLRPEESESLSAGMIVTPRFVPGLRLSVDWTQITKTDNAINFATTSSPSDLATLVLFAPERITRGPNRPTDPQGWPGPITSIDSTLINGAQGEAEAYDFALDYESPVTRWGQFGFFAKATELVDSTAQLVPSAPIVENAGVRGNVRWRANGTLSWEYRNWNVAWTTRHFGSYWLNVQHTLAASQGSATIPSQTYHDLDASYRFDSGILSGTLVRLGVNNVLDTEPPIDVISLGARYYSTLGDPRLANYYISVRKAFP